MIVGLGRAKNGLVWDYSISAKRLRERFVLAKRRLAISQCSELVGQISLSEKLLDDMRSLKWLADFNRINGHALPIICPDAIRRGDGWANVWWHGRKKTHYEVFGLEHYPVFLPDYATSRLSQFASIQNRIEVWVPTQPGVCQILFVLRAGAYHLNIGDMHYDNPTLFEAAMRRTVDRMMPYMMSQLVLSGRREG